MTQHPPDAPRATSLFAPEDVVCFDQAHIVWAIRPDGEAWPWLLRRTDVDPQGCCCRACAPHEQLGRLPTNVRRRVNQCQAITSSGRRCRNAVDPPGQHCGQHGIPSNRGAP